jgi:lipid biosynthesis B12-binding/radical SAM protein
VSRVFLLSSNITVDPYPVYPLGMAVVAGALVEGGHTVKQFDFLASGQDEARLRRELREFAPEVVGMSLRNIDNVDSFSGENAWYLDRARILVELIREETRVPVLVGGPAFSIMPKAILDYIGADHGVVGEGEAAVCRVVSDLAAGRPVAPVVRAGGAGLTGSQMAAPRYDAEWLGFYREQCGMINLQTKRGCPYLCTYCSYPSLEGRSFRPRQAQAVADDLERVAREHPGLSVFFTDSIFNDPQGHYLAVAEEILRRDLNVRWCAFFRPEGLRRPQLALLKRAGLYALELGTDAASDATLRGLDKGFDFAEVRAVNDDCLAEELPCAHFVIFGGPGETPATVAEGLANMEQLGPAVVFAFSGIRLLPGTPLYARALSEGVVTEEQSLLKPFYYYSPEIDPEEMHAAIAASFRGRRTRIFPPSEGQERLSVMRRFGYSGILWDKLIGFKTKAETSVR